MNIFAGLRVLHSNVLYFVNGVEQQLQPKHDIVVHQLSGRARMLDVANLATAM
jgi:hypothetical protein